MKKKRRYEKRKSKHVTQKRKQSHVDYSVPSNKGSRAGSKEVKRMLYATYGHVCVVCHKQFKELQLHHIKPIRLGGNTTIDNGALMCGQCHPKYHKLYDTELNRTYRQDPDADFVKLFHKHLDEMNST